jgi:hypothetical protein
LRAFRESTRLPSKSEPVCSPSASPTQPPRSTAGPASIPSISTPSDRGRMASAACPRASPSSGRCCTTWRTRRPSSAFAAWQRCVAPVICPCGNPSSPRAQGKRHPRDWANPGRLRVLLKQDGKFLHPVIHDSALVPSKIPWAVH